MADWQLKPLQVPELAEEIPITPEAMTFGRDPSNTYTLPEEKYPHVSGHHARVLLRDEKPFVEDLQSKNGTLVNGKRVERTELKNGDSIQLGEMGPRFAVVSSAGALDATLSSIPVGEPAKEPRRDLGASTIMQVKKALGIPEEAKVTELLQTRSRHQNLKLAGILVIILLGAAVAVFAVLEQQSATDEEIARLRRGLTDLLVEKDVQEKRIREQEDTWKRAKSDLEERQNELRSRYEALAANDESAAKAIAEQLSGLQKELDFFNPVNLEQAKMAKIAKVAMSVVLVERTVVFRHPDTGKVIHIASDDTPNVNDDGRPFQRSGTGSGFCVSDQGWVMTNAHVVDPEPGGTNPVFFEGALYEPSTTLKVVFTGGSLRHPATLEDSDTDQENDVALLRIAPFPDMPHLEELDLGHPIPAVSTEVFLFGFPLGKFALHEGEKVVASTFKGILSREVVPYIQVTAGVYPGNSGGPLIDSTGRVIGIVTAVQQTPEGQTAASIGYALPIRRAGAIWPRPPGTVVR